MKSGDQAPAGFAIVVSPTPSHPADHGNRNRVHQMTSALAAQGLTIDFVLYPIDDDWQQAVPLGLADMQRAWSSVIVVPPSRPLHAPPAGLDHTVDEWWDPALERQVAWLAARRRYAVMLVNYAFLSRALLLAPPGCVRVLDTHDRLAGRRALFERHGERPEFFHTTEDEERVALARADVVVAIKESEAALFRAATDRPVVTIPFLPPLRMPPRRARSGQLRAGFIGADNRVNATNLRRFLARLELHRRLFLPELEMVVAGRVGRTLASAPGLVRMGELADVGAFYRAVDVVVAPLAFSTGLKVKVAEALAWGSPVVATEDAFDGFAAEDPFHTLPDLDGVCAALMELAADPARLETLRAATQRAAAAAAAAAAVGLAALTAAIAAHRHSILVVTDVAWWRRGCVMEERAHQAIAFLAAAAPVLAVAATEAAPDGPPLQGVTVRAVGPLRGAALTRRVTREVARLTPARKVLACWQSLHHRAAPMTLPVAVIADAWPNAAVAPARGETPPGAHDMRIGSDGAARWIGAVPLRHLPPGLRWERARQGGLLVLVETAADGLDPLRGRLAGLLRGCGGGRRVAVLRTNSFAADPALLRRLAGLGAPAAIVTVEMPQLGREVADCLGRCAGAAVFHLAAALYPQIAPPEPDGACEIVADAWAHAARIAVWLRDMPPLPASESSDDAGWSVVWRALSERAAAVRTAAAQSAPAEPSPRCEGRTVHLLSSA